MIIVSGWLRVDADGRAAYLDGCARVIAEARGAPGCVDFHLSADPLETDRVSIFEQWETAAAADAFRGSGTSDEQNDQIRDAQVFQHEVGSSMQL